MNYEQILRLITRHDILKIYERNNSIYDYLYIEITSGYFSLPLDTLTRLMKEWCYDNGYTIETRFNYPLQGVVIYPIGSDDEIDSYIDDGFGIGETELETVTKATHWVAKQKGLL